MIFNYYIFDDILLLYEVGLNVVIVLINIDVVVWSLVGMMGFFFILESGGLLVEGDDVGSDSGSENDKIRILFEYLLVFICFVCDGILGKVV